MHSTPDQQRPTRLPVLLGLILLAVVPAWLGLMWLMPPRHLLWGDEGTYAAMTASLVRDGDLAFGEADRTWVVERQPETPVTVILQQSGDAITYSKPVLYAFLAAPLHALLGESGMVVTNLLLLVAALLLMARYLEPLANASGVFWTFLALVGGTVLLVYVSWKMSDIALFSLTAAGLVLALGGRRIRRSGGILELPFGGVRAALAGGALLGGAISMRFTGAALAAAALGALIVNRRWRRALLVALSTVIGFVALAAVSHRTVGTANPYKAVRASFNQATGYPVGDRATEAADRFVVARATQSASLRPPWQPSKTLYSALYFIIGRHTGLLLYFPFVIVLLVALLGRLDRTAFVLLSGAGVVIGFYLVWMPDNYFGGSTFVGNRYFLGVLPVFLVALGRLPGRGALTVTWAVAAMTWGSAVVSVRSTEGIDSSSQAHTHAGLFRWLPFESTARHIDGLEERFWADDYVRFLDPFADVARWSFRLAADRPAAEILVATAWPGVPLEFVVAPKSVEVDVEISDWRGSERFQLPADPPAPPGLIEVPLSPAWRRHTFWWNPATLYNVRVLRFSLDTDRNEPTTAVVRYAGKGRILAPLAAELVALEPDPSTLAFAGTTTPIEIEIRNIGRRPWKANDLFPVRIGYRWPAEVSGPDASARPVALPRNVRPGEGVAVTLSIAWPDRTGSQPLVIELLREPAGRLGPLGRLTLFTTEVDIREPTAP